MNIEELIHLKESEDNIEFKGSSGFSMEMAGKI